MSENNEHDGSPIAQFADPLDSKHINEHETFPPANFQTKDHSK